MFDENNNWTKGTTKKHQQLLVEQARNYGLSVTDKEEDRIRFKFNINPRKTPPRY
jgi:hypothetical protein